VRVRFPTPVQVGPGAHPASCTMGTVSFPGVKSGRGVTLTPHPLLVPWLRKERATRLLTLRAVRPVHSLTACTRVQFTFTFYTLQDILTKLHNTLVFHGDAVLMVVWSLKNRVENAYRNVQSEHTLI